MLEFEVRFISSAGREESRTIRAGSELEAARQMIASGGMPVHVREIGAGWLEKLNQSVRPADRIKPPDVALFAEQLAEMLKAGVTVEQGLALLARQQGRAQLAALAERLLLKVRTGCALSQALSEEQSIPNFFSGLVRGAERGGRLAEGLSALSDYLMRQAATRSKIIATLTYPAIVVATSMFAFVFVLVVVIPEFAPLFAGEEEKLPLVTRMVLWLSELVTTELPLILLLSLGAPAAAWLLVQRVAGISRQVERIAGRLPPVDMALRLDVAKTIRVLGALLESGIDASEAVTLALESATSNRLRQGLLQAARQLREGIGLSDALRTIDAVPDAVISLIAVGERTGELGPAAIRAANLLELDTNRRIDQLISLLNPIAVVVLGAMIAILISGVMLGILSANQFALR